MNIRTVVAGLAMAALMSVPALGQNGEWHVTGGTLAGKTIPGSVFESMTLTINGSSFTAKSADKTSSGTVTLDANAAPFQTMVFKITGGADSGREIKAIYNVVASTMSIAFSKDGEFPEVMRSNSDNKYLLLSYGAGARQSVASSKSTTTTPGAQSNNVITNDNGNGAASGIE